MIPAEDGLNANRIIAFPAILSEKKQRTPLGTQKGGKQFK
jgi:hypothetical protein